MRAALPVPLAVALAALSCGTEPAAAPPACDAPEGCLRVERIDGTCQCHEWQLVSIKPVAVKYVVVGVAYAPLGNRSMVSYGHTDGLMEGDVTIVPPAASDFGSRWRSLVQANDGSDHVATLGPIDVGEYKWGPLVPVTGTSAALVEPAGRGISTPNYDVLARGADVFHLWINPEVAVAADYAGGRSAAWSSSGADVTWIEAGFLDGTFPPPENPYLQAILDLFDADDRAAILKYNPFHDPVGRDPSTIAGDPRFQLVETVAFDSGSADPVVHPVTWTPCSGTLTDADFPVLARSAEVAFGRGETLLLQHSVLSTTAACVPQHPGLMVGTSTLGCSIQAEVYVDRAFGTLLMLPTSVSAACTTP